MSGGGTSVRSRSLRRDRGKGDNEMSGGGVAMMRSTVAMALTRSTCRKEVKEATTMDQCVLVAPRQG
ncbi:unnamed protein product [Camellia sinensis]